MRAIAFAPALTSPLSQTPWPLLREGRCNTGNQSLAPILSDSHFRLDHSFHAASICHQSVSGSFDTPFGGLFSFHSRYCFAIGLRLCLGLGLGSPIFIRTILCALLFCILPHQLRLRDYHPLWCYFPEALAD